MNKQNPQRLVSNPAIKNIGYKCKDPQLPNFHHIETNSFHI